MDSMHHELIEKKMEKNTGFHVWCGLKMGWGLIDLRYPTPEPGFTLYTMRTTQKDMRIVKSQSMLDKKHCGESLRS